MQQARIFRRAPSTTQSGHLRYKNWRLSYPRQMTQTREPLMGWTSASETLPEVVMDFPTKDAAIAFASKHGIPYAVEEPVHRATRIRSYGENFVTDRRIPWSH